MKNVLRGLGLAAAAGASLALAGPALGAYKPSLDVKVPPQLGAKGTTVIHFAVAPTDDPTLKITTYVPIEFGLDTSAAPGTQIGDVEAKVTAADLGGATLPLTGQVQAASATTTIPVGAAQVPLAAVATVCTGTAAHAAFWLLVLQAAGQTLQVPAYVDPTAGAATALGSATIQVCLPPPDVPPGTPGRATFGAKLFDALLTLRNVFTNPSRATAFVWTSIWTPYNPGVGTAKPAGTVDARSINPLPVQVSLKGVYVKKTKSAKLTGKATAAGQALGPGLTIPLFGGAKLSGIKRLGAPPKTDAKGNFTVSRKILKTTVFQARLAIPAVDFTAAGCAAFPSQAPAGCVSATVGPMAANSNVVKVTPRK